uniref:Serpentine receptor class gamma n=1 Tax=Panagrolaimus davidi TaxID=227884 RepID=A0A914R8E7_9BILA
MQKIILIDPWKPWFFDHPQWDTVLWLISGYLIYFQSLIHSAVAINRAWSSFAFVEKNYYWWLTKIGRWSIWLLPIIPIGIAAPRFPGHSMYYYTKEGDLASKYVETHIQIYHSTAGPVIVLSTSAFSFILGIATILRYRYLFQQYKTLTSSMKKDMLLFGQAIIVLLFQLALASYYIMTLIATSNNLLELKAFASIYFGFINDISCLCSPIALLIICKFIQRDYINFFLNKQTKIGSSMKSVWNNTSIAPQKRASFITIT